jgi:cyanophycinase
MVLGPADASDEHLISAVDDADLIYLTGGDPLHLLHTLNGSRFLQKLRGAYERGAVVAGSSAGAMVLGSWMRFRGWRRALGFVEGTAILCHHELSQPTKLADELMGSAPPGELVLGIDSKTGCVIGAEDWEVLGPGAVTSYFQGRWKRRLRGDRIGARTLASPR